MGYFPVMLDLKNRPVLLIAGGPETKSKLGALLEAGASLTVIAEEDPGNVEELARAGRITWRRRGYQEGDLEGFFLVVSHPKDPSIHPRVFREAEARGIFLIAVDDPSHASAILPAVHRQGALILAASTSGIAPALAVRIKEEWQRCFGPEYKELLELLRPQRARLKEIPFERRKSLWYQLVDEALREVLPLLKAGQRVEAEKRVATFLDKGVV